MQPDETPRPELQAQTENPLADGLSGQTAEDAKTAGEPVQRESAGSRFLDWLSIQILMMAGYILSIGPLYWQWYASINGFSWPVLAIVYRPLQILAIAFPPFGRWLDWYISLWIY